METRLPPAGESDEIKIKLSSYHAILKELVDGAQQDPSQSLVISQTRIQGQPDESCATLNFEFDLEVLGSGWIYHPLLPVNMGLVSWLVTPKQAATHESYFGVHNSMHVLLIRGKGKFVVACGVEVPFENDRRRSVQIKTPKCASGNVTWTIPDNKNWQITCTPCLSSNLQSTNSATVLSATFAPTSLLTVQWTEFVTAVVEPVVKEPEQPVEQQKGEQILTCAQETSYSVGEGMLQIHSSFQFTLVHASRASFDFVLDPHVQVLQVETEKIKRWRLLDHVVDAESLGGDTVMIGDDGDDASSSTRRQSQQASKILRVELNYAATESVLVHISMEMSMGGTSVRDMLLPVMWCEGMSREKAHFVLEARTNVEVGEKVCLGVTPIDVSELPASLLSSATNPLLAFKSLIPKAASMSIDVTKHQDTEVLVCVIENALFEATVSGEGKILYRFRLNIRNTQRQYLRVRVPTHHTIWSTTVGGTTLKPAKDTDGRVMIPLQKASPGKNESSFVLEMVYLVEIAAMGSRGSFNIEFAQLDIPINVFMAEIFLPLKFKYGKFKGNLEKVERFSTHAVFSDGSNDFQPMVGQERFRTITNARPMQAMQMQQNVTRVGVVPVKVDVPQVGKRFKFEKLLVTTDAQNVVVSFRKQSSIPCCFL